MNRNEDYKLSDAQNKTFKNFLLDGMDMTTKTSQQTKAHSPNKATEHYSKGGMVTAQM
jgi:hypothetical protein